MESCNLDLDVFQNILFFADWITLNEIKKTTLFLNILAKKEIKKRLKSKYPFGEPNARVSIVTNDIDLESIVCVLNNRRIKIPKEKYRKSWVRNIIVNWFIYSFTRQEFILTNKLFKSIIRIMNKKTNENERNLIDEKRQTLVFRYEKCESILENIF